MVKVWFCPKCRSYDVRYTFGFGNLFGVIPKMKCFKCGYTNSVFPILVVDELGGRGKGVGGKKKKEHGFSRKTQKTRIFLGGEDE